VAIVQTYKDEFTGSGRVIRDYFIGPGQARETAKSLADKLGLPVAEVQAVLDRLVELDIVTKSDDKKPLYEKNGDFSLRSNVVR
jgi:hypothetical protein